jgi:hypothetical protein
LAYKISSQRISPAKPRASLLAFSSGVLTVLWALNDRRAAENADSSVSEEYSGGQDLSGKSSVQTIGTIVELASFRQTRILREQGATP